jgi:hypothetical protein
MRSVIVSLLVFALGLAALAGDLVSTSSTLGTAMADRVTVIGKPAKGSPEKLESTQLKKAGKSLAKFTGVLDTKGVTALLKAGKAIAKSQTLDPATATATGNLLGCVIDALAAQEAQLIADATALFAPGDRDTFQNYVDDARAQVAVAADVATPADQAFAAIKSAFALYAQAAKFVGKVIKKQDQQLLPIMTYPFVVQNRNGVKFTIQKISFDLVFTPQGGGTPVRITEDFVDHEDVASGFTLPYVMQDSESQFEIYPTLYRAVAAVVGPNPHGSYVGVIRFQSTKHGKADIPVDDAL